MGNNCKGICISGPDTLNGAETGNGEDTARADIVKHPVQLVTENRKASGVGVGPHSSNQGTAQNTMAITSVADSTKRISMMDDGVEFLF